MFCFGIAAYLKEIAWIESWPIGIFMEFHDFYGEAEVKGKHGDVAGQGTRLEYLSHFNGQAWSVGTTEVENGLSGELNIALCDELRSIRAQTEESD